MATQTNLAQALRTEASAIDAKVAARESGAEKDSNCGCKVAAGAARGVAMAATAALLGVPVGF